MDRWGDWFRARLRFVGFMSQAAFAKAVGCTQAHVSVLVRRDEPPRVMRVELADAVCRELCADRFIVFSNWRKVPPDSSPVLGRNGKQAIAAA